jgi:hypothetical protein
MVDPAPKSRLPMFSQDCQCSHVELIWAPCPWENPSTQQCVTAVLELENMTMVDKGSEGVALYAI